MSSNGGTTSASRHGTSAVGDAPPRSPAMRPGIRSCWVVSARPTFSIARPIVARSALEFRSSSPCMTSPCSDTPRRSTGGHGRTARESSRASSARRDGSSPSRSSRDASSSSCSMSRPEKISVVPNGVEDEFTRNGPSALGRLRARRRDARAAQESRPAHRGRATYRRRAARCRRPWLGRRRGRWQRCQLARGSRRRRARASLSRRRLSCVSLAVRGLRHSRARGHGVRGAGRDDEGQRDGGGRGRRGRARRRERPGRDRGRDRAGSRRARAARCPWSRTCQSFPLGAVAEATVRVYGEAAA